MHSLLRRWLHKCQQLTHPTLNSSVRKSVREVVKSAKVPTRYVCEELANEYAKFWAKIQEDNGEGLEDIQRNALERWHAFRFELGTSTGQYPLPLDFLVEVFDDYFFLGSLRGYLTVTAADETPANSTWVGLTTSRKRSMVLAPPEIHIQLKQLPEQQLWTRELVQDFLDTLLHEMSHAFLMIYSAPAGVSGDGRYRTVVETEGLTGHGPCWVKVAAAIAAEANRSLGGVWN